MNFSENARIYYDAARQEVLLRMQLRDQALLVYLTVVGAILGVSLSSNTQAKAEILLTIPFIALGVSILVSQHYKMAAIIGQYLTLDLEPHLDNKSLRHERFPQWGHHERVPQWDSSEKFFRYATKSANSRVYGHSLIVSVPCILALAINWEHGFKSTFPLVLVWWLALFCFVGSIWIIMDARSLRCELYKERKAKLEDGF